MSFRSFDLLARWGSPRCSAASIRPGTCIVRVSVAPLLSILRFRTLGASRSFNGPFAEFQTCSPDPEHVGWSVQFSENTHTQRYLFLVYTRSALFYFRHFFPGFTEFAFEFRNTYVGDTCHPQLRWSWRAAFAGLRTRQTHLFPWVETAEPSVCLDLRVFSTTRLRSHGLWAAFSMQGARKRRRRESVDRLLASLQRLLGLSFQYTFLATRKCTQAHVQPVNLHRRRPPLEISNCIPKLSCSLS